MTTPVAKTKQTNKTRKGSRKRKEDMVDAKEADTEKAKSMRLIDDVDKRGRNQQ